MRYQETTDTGMAVRTSTRECCFRHTVEREIRIVRITKNTRTGVLFRPFARQAAIRTPMAPIT